MKALLIYFFLSAVLLAWSVVYEAEYESGANMPKSRFALYTILLAVLAPILVVFLSFAEWYTNSRLERMIKQQRKEQNKKRG